MERFPLRSHDTILLFAKQNKKCFFTLFTEFPFFFLLFWLLSYFIFFFVLAKIIPAARKAILSATILCFAVYVFLYRKQSLYTLNKALIVQSTETEINTTAVKVSLSGS